MADDPATDVSACLLAARVLTGRGSGGCRFLMRREEALRLCVWLPPFRFLRHLQRAELETVVRVREKSRLFSSPAKANNASFFSVPFRLSFAWVRRVLCSYGGEALRHNARSVKGRPQRKSVESGNQAASTLFTSMIQEPT